MKKILLSLLVTLVLLTGGIKFAWAEGITVGLTVKNNGEIVYSGNVDLLPAGTISINDSSGNPHDTNADSVLSVVNTADVASAEFNISNLIYYDMFGAFYLKCLNVSGSELCDNWQYKVDGASPEVGMDSKILSGGENVVLYFGDENKAPAPEPEPEIPPTHGSSGGGGFMILNTVCEQGTKFSPTTGRPCTSFIPALSFISPLPTPPLPNTNFEEKPKNVPPPAPKNQIKKISRIAKQNTATAINTITPSPTPVPTKTPKKSWFQNLLDKIFSVF